MKAHGDQRKRPSKKHYLGPFVILRRRADGTDRILFEVPPRLRPEGWPPTIPLPVDEALRTGRLDPAEQKAIRRDAAELAAKMRAARIAAHPEDRSVRNMANLLWLFRRSDRWRQMRPRTQQGYDHASQYLMAWSHECGHPDPALITPPDALSVLRHFDDRPDTRRILRVLMKMVLDQAIELGWRADNPAKVLKLVQPKRRRAPMWTEADRNLYSAVARGMGRESIARAIAIMWASGSRVTDLRAFRAGDQYEPDTGDLRFRTSKTDEAVAIPLASIREFINAGLSPDGWLLVDEKTGKPYEESRLSRVFAEVRREVVARGGRHLGLRNLRHSVVLDSARAGCTVPEIAALTGHTLVSVNAVLAHYLPRDSEVARQALIKRGLATA